MTNLLNNPGFDEGHFNQDGKATLVVPTGWKLFYLDSMTFPGIGDGVAYMPESVVWNINGAPANEKDVFFRDGQYCWKVFKAWAPLLFALEQKVKGLTPGATYRFTVPTYPDIVEKYNGSTKVRPSDIWAAEARAGWSLTTAPWPMGQDQSGGAGVTWSPWFNEYNGTLKFGEYRDVWVDFVAPESGEVRVWLETKAKWGFQNNWFFDAASLVQIDGPAPTPQPGGEPERKWDRVAWLLPQDATWEEAVATLAKAFANRNTITWSADDALVADGHLTTRTVYVPYDRFPGDIRQFANTYYPGATLIIDDGEVPEPEPTIVARGCPVGVHLQMIPDFLRGDLADYISDVQPEICKAFSPHDCVQIKQWSPKTKVVFRHHCTDQHNYLWADPIEDGVQAWIDRSWDALEYICDHVGDLGGIYFESLNEETPTYNPSKLNQLVKFEVAFLKALKAIGLPLKASVMNGAVGNPHETEVHLMLPMAEAACEYGAVIGYHGYWGGNPTKSLLLEHWQWLAGRMFEWDRVFAAEGYEPEYYCGEAGVCGATTVHLPPTPGWRGDICYQGQWPLYAADFVDWCDLVDAWNADHNNRFLGATFFTTSDKNVTGWDTFQIVGPELQALRSMMKPRYPRG